MEHKTSEDKSERWHYCTHDAFYVMGETALQAYISCLFAWSSPHISGQKQRHAITTQHYGLVITWIADMGMVIIFVGLEIKLRKRSGDGEKFTKVRWGQEFFFLEIGWRWG